MWNLHIDVCECKIYDIIPLEDNDYLNQLAYDFLLNYNIDLYHSNSKIIQLNGRELDFTSDGVEILILYEDRFLLKSLDTVMSMKVQISTNTFRRKVPYDYNINLYIIYLSDEQFDIIKYE